VEETTGCRTGKYCNQTGHCHFFLLVPFSIKLKKITAGFRKTSHFHYQFQWVKCGWKTYCLLWIKCQVISYCSRRYTMSSVLQREKVFYSCLSWCIPVPADIRMHKIWRHCIQVELICTAVTIITQYRSCVDNLKSASYMTVHTR
jgi:hypothetical protein